MEEIILQQAATFVTDLFENKLSPKNLYHNIAHTERVLENVTKISKYENCNAHDIFLLKLAAWFHDTGYTVVEDVGHEFKSVEIIKQFFDQISISEEDKLLVEKLI